MADNKVIFTLEIQQKGQTLSVVQKQTDKLAKSTQNVENAERKRNKTANTTYSRQKQGIIQTANSTKNFSKLAGSIDGGGGGPGGLVRAYALLAANVFALSAAFNVFSRAAQVDTLVDSMRQLEIVSGKSIMSVARDLQEATGYGMSFAESMRSTSLALSAGFDSSQISALGEVARNAAVSLGRNLPDALDRIFRGVIKVEPELLDEIGLFVRVNDASAKYAATIGKSVGDLTEFEKRQAFLNEALDQGTQKFAAFAEVENDPFALLATTFADISQAVLSFLNNAIGPAVKFLAENKMIFSIIFGAVAFTLLKMAIPAMGAFTNSMAVNAATAKDASDKQIKANRARAQESRKSHKAFLDQEIEKKKALAATARAESQKGPKLKLAVRGKKNSANLEKALAKELSGKARLQVIDQRILDLTKAQGLEKRKQLPGYQEELSNLQAEAALERDILATQQQQRDIPDTSGFSKGSLQDLETIKLTKNALISQGVAKVTNTAQTHGLVAAMNQLNIELLETEAALLKEGITMSWLDKIMFKLKAGTASLAVSMQTLFMTIMPWITGFLMLLPLLKMFAKFIGFGSAEAEELKEKTKAAADAIDLLAPRVTHLNKQFAKQDMSAKDYNIGMEAFNETILSTVTALREQEDAFNTWKESTNAFVYFIAETLPASVGFGTQQAMENQRQALLKGLQDIDYELSPKMEELTKKLNKKAKLVNVVEFFKGFGLAKAVPMLDTVDEFAALEEQIKKETEATNNFRSAVNGLTDSARAFSNAFLVTTNFDKPLASLNQVISTMNAFDDDGLILTDEQRVSYAKELVANGAVRAILSQEENQALKESVESADKFNTLLEKVRDRFFLMQELTIRMKSNMADMVDLQKQLSRFAKMSGTAATLQLSMEKEITALKIKQLQMNVDNTKSQTNLTEEQLRQFAAMDSLLPLVEREVLKKEELKAVMAAIHNLRILDNMVTEQQVENATRSTRQELARAEVLMTNLDLEEKINKEKISQLKLDKTADKFRQQGSIELTIAEKINQAREIANIELETVDKKHAVEVAISNMKFKILSIEARMLENKARKEKKALDDEMTEIQKKVKGSMNFGTFLFGGTLDPLRDLTEAEKETYNTWSQRRSELEETIGNFSGIVNEITKQSELTASLITEKFKTGAKGFLNEILGLVSEGLPGVTEDSMNSGIRNQRTAFSAFGAIDDSLDVETGRIEGRMKEGMSKERGEGLIKIAKEDAAAAKVATSINLMETNLMQFADNITNVFGEDGVFVSAIANVAANITNLGQNFGAEFEKATSTAGEVAVVTGAAASAIGNMIQLSAAQAQQQTGEIDKLIEAEEKRDGKSAQSVAKIKALEAKKEAIKRKAFESNKKMMLAQAVMSTASGIASAMAGPPGMPWSAGFVAAAAAMGLMQINLIKGMTYSGGGGETPKAGATNLTLGGGRSSSVDVAKNATEGELSYLRGQRGIGTNANNFKGTGMRGGMTGMKGYASGAPITVGEQGPEVVVPADIIPNESMGSMGGTNITLNISAIDGQSVATMFNDNQGNIIQMIRDAANENGTDFLPTVDPTVYGTPGAK